MNPTSVTETAEAVETPVAVQPSSWDDFELMPIKACLINDPECESCQ